MATRHGARRDPEQLGDAGPSSSSSAGRCSTSTTSPVGVDEHRGRHGHAAEVGDGAGVGVGEGRVGHAGLARPWPSALVAVLVGQADEGDLVAERPGAPASKAGISSMQGTHHEAKKLTTTGRSADQLAQVPSGRPRAVSRTSADRARQLARAAARSRPSPVAGGVANARRRPPSRTAPAPSAATRASAVRRRRQGKQEGRATPQARRYPAARAGGNRPAALREPVGPGAGPGRHRQLVGGLRAGPPCGSTAAARAPHRVAEHGEPVAVLRFRRSAGDGPGRRS